MMRLRLLQRRLFSASNKGSKILSSAEEALNEIDVTLPTFSKKEKKV